MPDSAKVSRAYLQPYPDPIRVAKGEAVVPDFGKATDIPGWVWCTDARGKSGWTPRSWLREENGRWIVLRDFDAIELTVAVGDEVTVLDRESHFCWVVTADGRRGWVPEDHLSSGSGG